MSEIALPRPSAGRGRTAVRALARRWPAALGLGFGLLSAWDLADGLVFADILALAAFVYVLVAVLDRPRLTWPFVLLLSGGVVLFRATDLSPVPAYAAGALVLAVAGVVSGRLRQSALHLLQSPAALLFGAVALVATTVSTEAGSYLVAVGLIAHAVWDTVLRRADRVVVSRTFVEWCAVFDVVVGVAILAVM